MILEQQVVSLELAKKLKDLGFKGESLFVWVCRRARKNRGEKDDWYLLETNDSYNFTGDDKYSACTVAELGEMLPHIFWNKDGEWLGDLEMSKHEKSWVISYHRRNDGLNTEEAATEADARAKMLIYLKENNLI